MGYYYFMSLSSKTIEDFKRVYKEEFGIELTDSEAQKHSNNLVKYFELLIRVDNKTRKIKK